MANSKGRRKLKRLLKEQGLSLPQQPPAIPQPQNRKHLWKRVPRWFWTAIVAFSVLLTILAAYPWLSIDENQRLDEHNPFSTLFSIANGGYIPVTNITAACDTSFAVEAGNQFGHNVMTIPDFANYLAHGGRVTIPCFEAVDMKSVPITSAELIVTITYSFYHLDYQSLRRHQIFRFNAIKGSDGIFRWTFLS